MRILVSRNVQPLGFSLINGTVNDLIQYFGSTVTAKQETYLPIILYSRHDKITSKKKKEDHHELHTQAGNVLGMKLEHFKHAHLEYSGSWVNDYALTHVLVRSNPDPRIRLCRGGGPDLFDRRHRVQHAQAGRQKSNNSAHANSGRHEEVSAGRVRRERCAIDD